MAPMRLQDVLGDPDFHGLAIPEKRKVLLAIDPDFGQLPTMEQDKVMAHLGSPKTPVGSQAPTPRQQSLGERIARGVGSTLPVLGSIAGGVAALPANLIAPGVAEATGAGLGYLAGKQGERFIESFYNTPKQNALAQLIHDAPEAAVTGMAGPLAGKALSGVGSLAKGVLGKMTSRGSAAITDAYNSGKEITSIAHPFKSRTPFDAAMRTKDSGKQVVESFQGALENATAQRAQAFDSALKGLDKKGPLNVSGIDDAINAWMETQGIKMAEGKIETAGTDYASPTLTRDVKRGIRHIQNWLENPEHTTPRGLYSLRRTTSDLARNSDPTCRPLFAQVREAIDETIFEAHPPYKDMLKRYREDSQTLESFRKTAGLKKGKEFSIDGRELDLQLGRLMRGMQGKNPGSRASIMKLAEQTNPTLSHQVSGHALNSWSPAHGMTHPLVMAGEGGLALHNPGSIPYLLAVSGATSPRLVGEAARLTGGLSALMNRPLGKAAVRGLGAYSAPYLPYPFRQ